MEFCGINKEIDKLGRLVIPKEMRELFNLTDTVEMVVTEDGILLCNPRYRLVRKEHGEGGEPCDGD